MVRRGREDKENFLYEIVVLGGPSREELDRLKSLIVEFIEPYGLILGRDVQFSHGEFDADGPPVARAAVYIGADPNPSLEIVQQLLNANVPVLPFVRAGKTVGEVLPPALQKYNALFGSSEDDGFLRLANVILECLGLLREQRRVFVSYRRVEARAAALQLHDELGARGFDVFLDTHSLREGEPFQDVLWHRLCDSDVLLMLDTPEYFESKWTREELGRALAKDIHILRVVWPEYKPHPQTDLAQSIYLTSGDLHAPDGPILDSRLAEVCTGVERLRSRSIAARYLSITGKFRSEMTRIRAQINGIGPHRVIYVTLASGKALGVYPVVGFPTAETLNDISEKALASNDVTAVLLYDDVGIYDRWARHLDWLDKYIIDIEIIKVAQAAWLMAGLDAA